MKISVGNWRKLSLHERLDLLERAVLVNSLKGKKNPSKYADLDRFPRTYKKYKQLHFTMFDGVWQKQTKETGSYGIRL